MTVHVFVESMRHEMISALPIIIIPLMIACIFAVLECLSSRSHAKELNKYRYKRNSTLSATIRTKVDLEIKELTTR